MTTATFTNTRTNQTIALPVVGNDQYQLKTPEGTYNLSAAALALLNYVPGGS